MQQSTMQLLDKALATKKAAEWCAQFAIDQSTLSNARKRGHLSPGLAGNFAINLGEDAKHWITIAVLEESRESPLLENLRKKLLRQKLYLLKLSKLIANRCNYHSNPLS